MAVVSRQQKVGKAVVRGPVVEAPAVVEAPVRNMVSVMPVYAYMFEPYQRIGMPEKRFTLVERTSWVTCQLQAGLLVEE